MIKREIETRFEMQNREIDELMKIVDTLIKSKNETLYLLDKLCIELGIEINKKEKEEEKQIINDVSFIQACPICDKVNSVELKQLGGNTSESGKWLIRCHKRSGGCGLETGRYLTKQECLEHWGKRSK